MMEREWIVTAARRYERELFTYVCRMLGDEARAQDVVQEAFLELCRQSRHEIEPKLAPWLYAVCRRRAIDTLRKEQRMSTLSADPPTSARPPAELLEVQDSARAVLAKVALLAPREQEVVRLKFLQQFTYREIAEVMGLTESHVGVLLHTALKSLRQSLLTPEQRA
jgi:RNA polymerase sigma-70 factor (ECF subfamily)